MQIHWNFNLSVYVCFLPCYSWIKLVMAGPPSETSGLVIINNAKTKKANYIIRMYACQKGPLTIDWIFQLCIEKSLLSKLLENFVWSLDSINNWQDSPCYHFIICREYYFKHLLSDRDWGRRKLPFSINCLHHQILFRNVFD